MESISVRENEKPKAIPGAVQKKKDKQRRNLHLQYSVIVCNLLLFVGSYGSDYSAQYYMYFLFVN